MELELKHLASYLPYKLQIRHNNRTKSMNASSGSSGNWIGINTVIRYHKYSQIFLRPLSDFEKEIKINGEKFIPSDKVAYFEGKELSKTPINLMPKFWIDRLLEWHFDIFGLIKNGLAIDINEIKT